MDKLRSGRSSAREAGIISVTLDQFKNIKDKLNVKQKWDILFRAHQQKIRSFRPKISFALDHNRFTVKTIDTPIELEQVLRLRHEVFHAECLNKRLLTGLDFDRFDLLCDHLIIVDKASERIVGTYRVICSKFSDQFYTASEFNIDRLLELKGVKLELGRACIEKEFRTGAVIALLWRGIAQYIKLSQADYLFGCATVWTTNQLECAAIYKYLQDNGHTTDVAYAKPIGAYVDPCVAEHVSFLSRPEFNFDPMPAKDLLPALFKSYLKLGSKICGEPAYDRYFECYDFATLQEIKALKSSVERKYGLC